MSLQEVHACECPICAQQDDHPNKAIHHQFNVVLSRLGEGAIGIVFKARHRRMKRVVCLKVLRPSGRKSREVVERLGVQQMLVSISHCRSHATAQAIALGELKLPSTDE